jgi:TRAP-type C4-dicarboxylate transport system permease small subunit
MFAILLHVKRIVDRLLEFLLMVSVATMTLVVLWGVLTRFVVGDPSHWTEEVATNLLIWVALLGAAVAFSRQEHLGLDYFVLKLDPQAQRGVAILGQLAVLTFAASAMIYGGYVLASETFAAGQVTPVMGMKMGHVYLAVPLSGAFICLYSVERIVDLVQGKGSIVTPATSTETDQVDG